ncbi:MAG: WXG100 family type VII secretion target [Anaerolinea sp.]|nr:WXG100 family type VII secretion target [Anaerolinea sp.]
MAADEIRADYEQLAQTAKRFDTQGQQIQQMAQNVQRSVETLRNGWEGRGAHAFFGEMQGTVLPGVNRLHQALTHAGRVTQQISRLLRQAEEEASQPFRDRPAVNLTPASMVGERGENEVTPGPAPNPPGQSGSGDGSGAHGAAGAPTDADWETHRTMSRAALLARLRGYDITASHMEHYLGNSGQPLSVDVNRMMSEMPEFRLAVQQQFQHDIWTAAQREIDARYTGEPLQFQLTTDWRSDYYPDKSSYPNWYYGVGGFSYSQTAAVTVTPGPDSVPVVTVQSQVHMFDRYNWDEGKSVTLPSSGNQWIDDHTIAGDYIPDTAMGHLHQTGIAQEYDLNGSSSTTVTTYRYDPAANPADAPTPGAGGGR